MLFKRSPSNIHHQEKLPSNNPKSHLGIFLVSNYQIALSDTDIVRSETTVEENKHQASTDISTAKQPQYHNINNQRLQDLRQVVGSNRRNYPLKFTCKRRAEVMALNIQKLRNFLLNF